MKIESGHPIQNDVQAVGGNYVRFVAEDGRTMFEVTCGKDGHSIEVRGVNCCKVGGVLYSDTILIRPNAANSITVSTPEYDE